MAILKRLSDGTTVSLPAQCLVGRSAPCNLIVDDRFVSSEHAKIVWLGGSWKIRDLGSRNGTFVDGERAEPGRLQPLAAGARIGFGDLEEAFELIDVAGPLAMATDQSTREVRNAVGELLVLPDDDHPEITVYPSSTGGWVAEDTDGETRGLHDQAVIVAGGRSFRLDLPVLSEATPMVDVALTLENVTLRMAVSSDEERVALTILLRGEKTAYLEPREHSYLLLTLARAREEDHALPAPERGWRDVDQLLRMLKMDQNSLNVSIHRARQQLAATGLEGAANVVETKRGKRRLGTDRFEIVRLEE